MARRPVHNFRRHLRAAYRSGLEAMLAAVIAAAGLEVQFETLTIPYEQPAKARKYTPDFLLPNGIVIESKGLFSAEDRNKMQWVKAQHPKLDIRMVFSNAQAKLYKGSPTTYAMWCDREGFPWANKTIPTSWLTEPTDPVRVAAVASLQKKGAA